MASSGPTHIPIINKQYVDLRADIHRGYRHPFLPSRHFAGGVGDLPRTTIDQVMSHLSAEIRREPNWWNEYQEKSFRDNWTSTTLVRSWNMTPFLSARPIILSRKQITYILDELTGYAALRDEENNCITSEIRVEILKELALLRMKGLSTVDQDGGVSMLIDPALHCLVYGRTLVNEPGGVLSLLYLPTDHDYSASSYFALLPSDVSVSVDGKSVKFLSYVNNLDPKEHLILYTHLSTSLACFIPLFEHVLTDLHRSNPLRPRVTGRYRYSVWDEPDPPEHSDDDEGWDAYEQEVFHWERFRPIVAPDVPIEGYVGGLEHRKHLVTLRGRTIQVIVSISEIKLNDDTPRFPGTEWHVKGMLNERIITCGLYCLSAENVTSSLLQFRMAVEFPRAVVENDSGATLRTWGLTHGSDSNHVIGEVPIRQDLSLAFPNIYQHRQTSFIRDKPDRDGILTMISFCLVDPDIRPIPSTSTVAPQQKNWIRKSLYESIYPQLPSELIEKILGYESSMMDPDEAMICRSQLLGIRRSFRELNNRNYFCIPYNIGYDIGQ